MRAVSGWAGEAPRPGVRAAVPCRVGCGWAGVVATAADLARLPVASAAGLVLGLARLQGVAGATVRAWVVVLARTVAGSAGRGPGGPPRCWPGRAGLGGGR